jgi:hypothetical protein
VTKQISFLLNRLKRSKKVALFALAVLVLLQALLLFSLGKLLFPKIWRWFSRRYKRVLSFKEEEESLE